MLFFKVSDQLISLSDCQQQADPAKYIVPYCLALNYTPEVGLLVVEKPMAKITFAQCEIILMAETAKTQSQSKVAFITPETAHRKAGNGDFYVAKYKKL